MKRIELWLIIAIIVVFSWSIHLYYDRYARPDLPENVEPAESVFSIEAPVPEPVMAEVPIENDSPDRVEAASVPANIQTRPATADLLTAKKLSADLLLWPLHKTPDFWLFKAYLLKQKSREAERTLVEALEKPQPWHLRFVFTWLLARLKFVVWLEQKPEIIETQVRDAIVRVVGGFPAMYAGKKFVPGVGYLASDAAILQSVTPQKELIASATAALVEAVNEPEHFARRFLQDRIRSQRYCQKRCRSANMLLAPPEISERYAEVDYVYQARLLQMSSLGIARVTEPEAIIAELERSWGLPNLPVCCGNVYVFTRHHWSCPLHEQLDVELTRDAGDALDEAWTTFLLCNPQHVSLNFE